VIRAGEHDDIGILVGLSVDKEQKNESDDNRTDDGKRNHSGGKNDTGGNRPEEERDIKGFLDGGTETHNRERTDHTERQNDVRGDRQNHLRGNHRKSNERDAEGRRIHYALIGFLINKENEKAETEGKCDSQHHIKDADGSYVFEKA